MLPFDVSRKAVVDTLVGVSRKVAIFLGVALCFYALLILREWHTSYAPGDAWADTVKKEGLEWSPIVSAAARAMPKPKQPYNSATSFYADLSSYLKEEKRQLSLESPIDRARFQRYQGDVEARKDTRAALHTFWQKSVELVKTNEVIATGNREIKELRQKTPLDKKTIGEKEGELGKSRERRGDILEYMKELSSERAMVEAGLQRLLTDLDTRIKSSEDGIREAFEAAVPSARPVGRVRDEFQAYAIQLGDETHPLHVFYVIAWYGLKAVIVLLLCVIFVPWLIYFGGTSDPETVRSKVPERIRGLLGNSFSQGFGKGVGKTLVVAAVGSVAVAGVTMAAGNPPPITSVILHENGQGAKGEDGRKGDPGDPGKDALDGNRGGPGDKGDKGEDSPPLKFLVLLDYQDRKLEEQEVIIRELEGKLERIDAKVDGSMKELQALAQETNEAIAQSRRLSSGMGELTQDISRLGGTVGDWITTNQSILRLSNTTNSYLLGSMSRLEGSTAAAAENVRQVRITFDQAAADVPIVTTDLLRINAIPDGAWARVSPFRRYEVTNEVEKTVERAMKGVEKVEKVRTQKVLSALAQVKTKGRMRVGGFREELYTACAQDAHDLLEQWMPLIMKLSRIPE